MPVQVVTALDEASKVEKPPLSDLFTDVYAQMPWHLREQMEETISFAKRHPEIVPQGVPVR
jgi:2-oxoisovalerate dehydrogenase E1 component alpha subunit